MKSNTENMQNKIEDLIWSDAPNAAHREKYSVGEDERKARGLILGNNKIIAAGGWENHVKDTSKAMKKVLDFQKSDSVLDIGSGSGDHAKGLSDVVKKVYCCDINKSFLSQAEKNCQGLDNISFHLVEDVDKPLSFLPDSTIDKAYARAVFVHNPTHVTTSYLKEAKRVLRPNGLFWAVYLTKKIPNVASSPFMVESSKKEIDDCIKSLGFKAIWNTERSAKDKNGGNSGAKLVTLLLKV